MTLTFGFETPRDVLEKARRDLSKLETAVLTQDHQKIGDALREFAASAYDVKDWLKEHPGTSFQPQDVEDYVGSNAALSSCRDLCDAAKHKGIKRYKPTTSEVMASTTALTVMSLGFTDNAGNFQHIERKAFRTKVVRTDGSRHDVVDLARQAVQAWGAFFQLHGL